MPDHFVGHRTPEGGWSWEPAGSPKSRRHHRALLIALTAVGVAAACVLGAVIILTAVGDSAHSTTSGPSATPEPTFSLMVWNPETEEWQAENLNLTAAPGEGVMFLLGIDSLDRMTHQVDVLFECAGEGSIELIAGDDPAARLTEPGPGRLRPDATALGGALAAWNATFSGAPEWDARSACSELQTLNFVTASRGVTPSFMWEVSDDAGPMGRDFSLSVAASVDGEPALTVSVGY